MYCFVKVKKNQVWLLQLIVCISYNSLIWPQWLTINYVSNPSKSIFHVSKTSQWCHVMLRPVTSVPLINTMAWTLHCVRKSRPSVCQRSNTHPQCVNLQGVRSGCAGDAVTDSTSSHPSSHCKEVLLNWCKREIFSQCQQCCLTCLVKPKFSLVLVWMTQSQWSLRSSWWS